METLSFPIRFGVRCLREIHTFKRMDKMGLVVNLLILSVAVFLVSKLLPGIWVKNFGTAIVVSVVYSLINFLVGWLLIFLSLPFLIITFGLFKFVINAFMLWLTDKIIEDFRIRNFLTTLLAAFLITVVDSLIKWML